jgi:DNA processing protein
MSLIDIFSPRQDFSTRRVAEDSVQILNPESFPKSLSDLSSPPKQLYFQGLVDITSPSVLQNAVAIVGTRKPSEYGKNFAYELAKFLASRQSTVISGLALGIDAAAHRGSLDGNGTTIAVLGTGMDIIYPRENKDLFTEISQRGLLLTEFKNGQPPEKYTFPMRNRIIAALANALVVVESDETGGAMITASLARKIGRRVFALPGRVDQSTSRGPNKLIQQGATLITSVEDFWEQFTQPFQPELFSGKTSQKKKSVAPKNLPPELQTLLEGVPLSVDELAQKSNTPVEKLMGIILTQEIEGNIARRLDGKYEIV